MKIAVPVKGNNTIDEHFGHCDFFSIYSISEKNEIEDVQTIKSPQGCGCKSNMANVLAQDGVTLMLAGGIGGGAINAMNNAGIEVIRGCSGNAMEIVKLYITGMVKDSGVNCHAHEHTHEHTHECNH
jgi:predicted Fe-Mo cluster-binding NifX family protein